jgi:serine/threonine protein kinase
MMVLAHGGATGRVVFKMVPHPQGKISPGTTGYFSRASAEGSMSKLKNPISFETTFGTYVVDEILGEGGAGRVYGGVGIDQTAIAVKVLARDRATADKRRRFKNEIAFLSRNKHTNIVTVLDHGISPVAGADGPFYVMPRYQASLRDLISAGIKPERVLHLFSQIIDGVEAAHLEGVFHRDLKPENILCDEHGDALAIADFGTARFTEDFLVTQVATATDQRLANFQYAAPEQRMRGKDVHASADIYALGLILNEMFTGLVPHGTEYRSIAQSAENMGFLDAIVAKMLRQTPAERPSSIAELKGLIRKYETEAVSLQRLSEIEGTVIKEGEIDEPLALTPPKLIGADWNRGTLTLTLDRPVNDA